MKILTVDIGTGTQDIFLYDSRLEIENGFKLVVPSPTMIVHGKLREATRQGKAVLLSGITMGGGPSQWAAEAHARAGLPIYALPQAARSFNDDLQAVQTIGITVISQDEADRMPDEVLRLEMKDFDFAAIARSLQQFGISLNDLSAVAVAVFDHGNAPPYISDRQFRFDYLDERIRSHNRLSAFAYQAADVPSILTRLQAVVDSASGVDAPLVVMDTAPAAVLGCTFDPLVAAREQVLVVNVGNFHTLAFRMGRAGIEAVFEHHTGLLDCLRLDGFLRSLLDGSLKHQEVFDSHGHGALVYNPQRFDPGEGEFGIVVTGPRRSLMRDSGLRPYFAVPFGDMMIAGCIGLLSATADLLPELADAINLSLKAGAGRPPWE